MMAAPIIDAREVEKLSNVAELLRSGHDGEVSAAGRMLVKLLDKHGITPGEVVRRALMPTPCAPLRPKPVKPLRDHQLDALRCLAAVAPMWNDRERGFLADMAAQRHSPSPGQADWLASMVRRVDRHEGSC